MWRLWHCGIFSKDYYTGPRRTIVFVSDCCLHFVERTFFYFIGRFKSLPPYPLWFLRSPCKAESCCGFLSHSSFSLWAFSPTHTLKWNGDDRYHWQVCVSTPLHFLTLWRWRPEEAALRLYNWGDCVWNYRPGLPSDCLPCRAESECVSLSEAYLSFLFRCFHVEPDVPPYPFYFVRAS